jgi:hypothetical protein
LSGDGLEDGKTPDAAAAADSCDLSNRPKFQSFFDRGRKSALTSDERCGTNLCTCGINCLTVGVSQFQFRGLRVKKFLALVAASLALAAAGTAGAVTVNFAREANLGGERGVADGTVLNTSSLGGLNLRFSAGRGREGFEFAYFNAFEAPAQGFKGRQAGLGVCTTLAATGLCAAAGDDTVDHGEFVRVDFVDSPFEVARMSFNGRFASNDASPLLLKVTTSLGGAVSTAVLSFAEATTRNFGFVDWIQWDFIRDQGVDAKFFVASISSVVPTPGAMALLLSGLAGLGFAASRRRAD